jgi:carboxypeptidase C (cathepsin A)
LNHWTNRHNLYLLHRDHLNEYNGLKCALGAAGTAYIFNEARSDPSSKPLTTWHQGGPGGNSFYGLFGEGGYFQVAQDGPDTVTFPNNATSWNLVSNMLYLDSPAGSNDPIGFSTCNENGKLATICSWNDVTQAEAYASTLLAFYKAFPEYATNELYLTGESYAG